MDLNYIFNCMNIIIYNNNYCMQYILSREYMCQFFPLQKTSSSTIELSNHLLQATTNSLRLLAGRGSTVYKPYEYNRQQATPSVWHLQKAFDKCLKKIISQ